MVNVELIGLDIFYHLLSSFYSVCVHSVSHSFCLNKRLISFPLRVRPTLPFAYFCSPFLPGFAQTLVLESLRSRQGIEKTRRKFQKNKRSAILCLTSPQQAPTSYLTVHIHQLPSVFRLAAPAVHGLLSLSQ